MLDLMIALNCRWSEIEEAMRLLFDGGRRALKHDGGNLASLMAEMDDEELAHLVHCYYEIVVNVAADEFDEDEDYCDGDCGNCPLGPEGDEDDDEDENEAGANDDVGHGAADDGDVVLDMGHYIIRANKESFSIQSCEGAEIVLEKDS